MTARGYSLQAKFTFRDLLVYKETTQKHVEVRDKVHTLIEESKLLNEENEKEEQDLFGTACKEAEEIESGDTGDIAESETRVMHMDNMDIVDEKEKE